MSYAIEVTNLVKRFGSIQALNDANFKIEKGEVFGLIGPNGAGKTTALRIISTLIAPTSGSVKVFDIDVVKQPSKSVKLLATCQKSQAFIAT